MWWWWPPSMWIPTTPGWPRARNLAVPHKQVRVCVCACVRVCVCACLGGWGGIDKITLPGVCVAGLPQARGVCLFVYVFLRFQAMSMEALRRATATDLECQMRQSTTFATAGLTPVGVRNWHRRYALWS